MTLDNYIKAYNKERAAEKDLMENQGTWGGLNSGRDDSDKIL